jgi:hypothetical protein
MQPDHNVPARKVPAGQQPAETPRRSGATATGAMRTMGLSSGRPLVAGVVVVVVGRKSGAVRSPASYAHRLVTLGTRARPRRKKNDER